MTSSARPLSFVFLCMPVRIAPKHRAFFRRHSRSESRLGIFQAHWRIFVKCSAFTYLLDFPCQFAIVLSFPIFRKEEAPKLRCVLLVTDTYNRQCTLDIAFIEFYAKECPNAEGHCVSACWRKRSWTKCGLVLFAEVLEPGEIYGPNIKEKSQHSSHSSRVHSHFLRASSEAYILWIGSIS